MSGGTLVVAFPTGETIDEAALEAVTAAAALGGRVTLGIVAANPEAIASSRGIEGVDDLVGVAIPKEAAGGDHDRQAVRAMIDELKPQVIMMSFAARTAAFAAALAYELGLGFACNAVRVGRDEAGELTATRLLYGGKVHVELEFDEAAPVLLLLRPSVWSPAGPYTPRPCRLIASVAPDSRTRHVGYVPVPDSGYDLTRQEVILAVGRGVGSKDGIAVFSEIAGKLGAALGASRPIVDAGWLPRDHQIGQSGVSVAPRVYLAFGISGALQHLAGIRGAKTVIAINSDSDAPIFGAADYGAVADIFEVATELKKMLA